MPQQQQQQQAPAQQQQQIIVPAATKPIGKPQATNLLAYNSYANIMTYLQALPQKAANFKTAVTFGTMPFTSWQNRSLPYVTLGSGPYVIYVHTDVVVL